MRRQLRFFIGALLMVAFAASTAVAQTGKIAGQVTDAESGEPLPGVNVVIQGTTMGATTDAEGYYQIINVPPGTYTVQASFVGYATQRYQGVEVNIDLTTQRNFQLPEETEQLQEVTVEATEPVVKPDVSANVANIETEQIQDMPVAGVEEVLSLQAGIEPGLSVRGGDLDELGFVVDGSNMRTGRDNNPFTSVSFTSVKEMQVQTGGFAAEYGNVRSGLINVVTKDAPRDRYMVDAFFRYKPAQAKNVGGELPGDPDSFFKKPFLPGPNQTYLGQDVPKDKNPAWVGTDASMWDEYEKRQYPPFVGWNKVSEQLAGDGDPGNNLTPQQLVELFNFRTRKSNKITDPDYVADVTVGGPLVPGLSDNLGDLRFLASYRGNQTAYMYPQRRRTYNEHLGQFKVTTNFTSTMKLTLQGMVNTQRGMNSHHYGGSADIYSGWMPTYPWGWLPGVATPNAERAETVFSKDAFNPVNVDHRLIGGDFTHTLGSNTFYKFHLQRMSSEYRSKMPKWRNQTRDAFCIDGNADQSLSTPGIEASNRYCVNERPMGFAGEGGNILGAGYTTGGHWAKARDTTDVAVWTGEFDITSQLNRFLQVKSGVDLYYSDYNIRWGRVGLALGSETKGPRHIYDRQPIQGAAYAQSKLEFQGMIANVGARLDYMDVNEQWWVYPTYPRVFQQRTPALNRELEKEPTEAQYAVSPRIGVSFPVTEDSKLYFNYGHFRQMVDPQNLFDVTQSLQGGIDRIGNPNHPMPKTVAYELGFDQNLADMFLLRISGYYRDVRKQPRWVSFDNLDGSVQYNTFFPWNYEDIRGAEISFNKTRGEWIRGFLNFTYTATKSGNFGFSQFHENTFEQRAYLRNSSDYTIYAPVPQPYARLNLEFLVPQDYGPTMGSINPLGNWRASFLVSWRQGDAFTWTGGGGGYPQLQNNVSWRDYYNADLRITKSFNTSVADVNLFADISNVFNIRHIYRNSAFIGTRDWFYYMTSLHLPGDIFEGREPSYQWIHGDDQPGDFRDPDVEFQPIEVVSKLEDTPDHAKASARAWVYSKQQQDYFKWNGSEFVAVDEGKVEEALDKKAYIDMPNSNFSTFLNPRRVLFGLRLSF